MARRIDGIERGAGDLATAPYDRGAPSLASLDELAAGIALLDNRLRVTFVNRAFREIWQIRELDHGSGVDFIELMRMGCVPLDHSRSKTSLDACAHEVAVRVATNDATPVDLRLLDGGIVRLQCVAISPKRKLVSCVRIAELARCSDAHDVLRDGIDSASQGIVLISGTLKVEFMNRRAQRFWSLGPEQCGGRLSLAEFVNHVRRSGLYAVPDDEIDAYVNRRITMIEAGDPTPVDIPVVDGKTLRAQCTALAGGGRMLTYTDITDLVQQVEQQQLLATIDVLTGLYNRRHFQKLADAEWRRCQRRGHALSLLFFDPDNLKALNDALGHDAGDQAIVRVAEVCNAVKRTCDIAGRIGGDEFAILMPESDKCAALSLAERLRKSIGRERLQFDGICPRLTVSIGIAQAWPELDGLAGLLKRADARLYRAKRAGRNCTAWSDTPETLLRA